MGIKGLWNVFAPYSEKKSLHEIRGEVIAVDLSGWVCDSQNVTEYHVQPKLYLRNLFFRTIYLILADITPIFVLDGEAPELKQDVMAARNAIQFRGAAPKSMTTASTKPDRGRKRFSNVLKECESLLKCMGVTCIKAEGEAESTCAQLNSQGLVNAIVSQDSDCFAYGAKRVYRNFSVSNSAGGGALQGSVDCYDADVMYKSNGFGRNKMIALAILCGCDYGVGACGSSINTALTFLHTVPDNEIIPRLLSWVTDTVSFDEKTRWANAPGRCDRCGHVGRSHMKSGCPVCATNRGCEDLGHKSKVTELKRELSLRDRAMSCGKPFPEPRVMNEFMNKTAEKIYLDSLKAPAPSLIQFVKLMTRKLDWPEKYCVVKFLPILTKWHLQDNLPLRTIKPLEIKKKRNPRGVPSFEVVWCDIDSQYEALVPDDQFEENEDPSAPWTSIERQDLMRKYYPDVVEKFEETTRKPVKEKKGRGRKIKEAEIDKPVKPKRNYNKKSNKVTATDKNIDLKSASLANDNRHNTNVDHNSSKANVSVNVNKLKRKYKSNARAKGQKTMESFILNKKRKSSSKLVKSITRSFKNISIANIDIVNIDKENKVRPNSSYLNMLDVTNEDVNDSELSDIVDRIVSRAPTSQMTKVNNKLLKLVFDNPTFNSTPRKSDFRKSVLKDIQNNSSTPNGSPILKEYRYNDNFSNSLSNPKMNFSYFFDKLTEEQDAFEMSLERLNDCKFENGDIPDKTVDYSLPSDSLPDVCF